MFDGEKSDGLEVDFGEGVVLGMCWIVGLVARIELFAGAVAFSDGENVDKVSDCITTEEGVGPMGDASASISLRSPREIESSDGGGVRGEFAAFSVDPLQF
mmetsp:Transcript_45856/g.55650  ORF Transcript_45856/g.55650 Transcript_45856/m.55650 type:complete len:101 (+) Transcript_45856:1202-1504(+)